VALAGIVAIYGALVLPTVGRTGIQWDEQSDLEIAGSFYESRRAPLRGSRVDVINVRLPMFSVASLQLLGIPLELRTARVASCAVGALTLIGVFLFARQLLGRRRALLAALLIAINPYFLAFSPLAFTEGDVFVACGVAWVLFAFAWLWQAPSRIRGLAAGLALGFAFSSKFSALSLVPAVLLGGLMCARPRLTEARAKELLPWLGVLGALGAWLLLQGISTGAFLPWVRDGIPGFLMSPLLRLGTVFALLVGLAAWAARRPGAPLDAVALHAQPLLVASAVFFVLPPSHTTNGLVFSSLWRESLGAGGGFSPAFAAEAAALHLLVVWIKPSLGIGTAFLLGAGLALARWRRRPALRWPLAVLAIYGAALLTLPWAQVRYPMALVPVLAVLAADLLVELYERRRRWGITAGVAIAALWAVDMALCYPDLNLNGHQWLGTRFLAGRSTLGYRSIGQVGNDGLEQAVRWVDGRAGAGETVIAFSVARHIVQAARSPESPAHWVDGVAQPDALAGSDWVVTQLNDDILDGYGPDNPSGPVLRYPRYDRAVLEAGFDKVFAVRRRLDLEVATVWRRR
jgi:hypothetical protein